jgi:hypothetical protein
MSAWNREQQRRRDFLAMERVNEQEPLIRAYRDAIADCLKKIKSLPIEGWSPNAHYDISDVTDLLQEFLPDGESKICDRLEADIRSDMFAQGSV